MIQQEQQSILGDLKYIYDNQIPVPDRIQEKQKTLFYFNLTENNLIQEQLKKLVIDEVSWINGFQGNLNTRSQNKNKVYYFENIIIKQNDNLEINIKELIRIRLFLQQYVVLFNTCSFKLIIHVDFQEKDENQIKQNIMINAYYLFDGFHLEELNFIILNSKKNLQSTNLYSMKLNSIQNISSIDFHESFQKLDYVLFEKIHNIDEYLIFFQKECITIGFKSQQYIQAQIDVILKLFNLQLQQFQNNLQQLQEYPIDIQNENKSEEVKQYYQKMKQMIDDIRKIFTEHPIFLNLVIQIPEILKKYKDIIIEKFEIIVPQIRQLKLYLNSIEKGERQIQKNFEFKFVLNNADRQIMENFKQWFDEDELQQTIFSIYQKTQEWYMQFDQHIPQSLTIMRKLLINANKFDEFKETIVFLLGITRVGKSTLINILEDPTQIIVNKEGKFDVENKNKQFKISQENNSETWNIGYIKINDYVFVDTPGILDTNEESRIFNLINIFKVLKSSKKFIILIMIDGAQLMKNKNDLLSTIKHIISMLPKEIIDSNLNSIILPLFTKLENEQQMKKIKLNWVSQTMQSVNDQQVCAVLKSIKEQIDSGNYLEIYDTQFYFQSSLDKLKQEKDKLQDELNEQVNKGKIQEAQEILNKHKDINHQIENIQNNQEEISFNLNVEKLQSIKRDVFNKCQVLKEKQNNNQSINACFQLRIPQDLQANFLVLINHWDKIIKHALDEIILYIICKTLYDKTVSINHKQKQIEKLQLNYRTYLKRNCSLPNNDLDLIRYFSVFPLHYYISQEKKQSYPLDNLIEYLNQILEEFPSNQIEKQIQLIQQLKLFSSQFQQQHLSCVNTENFNEELQILSIACSKSNYTFDQLANQVKDCILTKDLTFIYMKIKFLKNIYVPSLIVFGCYKWIHKNIILNQEEEKFKQLQLKWVQIQYKEQKEKLLKKNPDN